jgi:acetyl-CoA synthetase
MEDAYAWRPTAKQLEQTNVARFMARHGIDTYEELIERSTTDVEWFWEAMVSEIPVDFFQPYQRLLDSSRGMPWGRWFVGGQLNLAYNCLDRHAGSGRASKPAVVWEGESGKTRSITYSDLEVETNRLANGLKALGVGRGDRVGIFLPMVPEAVESLLACAKIGAIAVPIFSGFGAQAVAARLNDCETRVLITIDAFARRGHAVEAKRVADEAVALCRSVQHVVVVQYLGGRPLSHPGRDLWWHEVTAAQSSSCVSESMDAEEPFMIAYTSGTTGKPKGSVHVHGGFLVKIAQEVCHQVDLQQDDRLYWVTDMGWIMGPWEVVGALALGGTVFLCEAAPDYPGPDRIWSMVERHKISILGLSPTLVRALMKHGGEPLRKHDRSSLRILASTGEPWNPAPWMWYYEHVGGGRCPIMNFSGGTECGASLLSALPIVPLKPCALVGPALGMAVDVFDAEGKPLRGGVGELVCTRPWPGMTRGIWKDDGRYIATYWSRWPNVWVHGDWASIDADGCWFLHGRSDDTLKVAGKRLGPAEVESAIVGHPDVAESAAIGVPDDIKGEVVWCFVMLKPGAQASESLRAELCGRVVQALGKAFSPERIEFVADLPRTRSSKILRSAIRARVLNHDPGDLSSLENPAALEEIARAAERKASPGR